MFQSVLYKTKYGYYMYMCSKVYPFIETELTSYLINVFNSLYKLRFEELCGSSESLFNYKY